MGLPGQCHKHLTLADFRNTYLLQIILATTAHTTPKLNVLTGQFYSFSRYGSNRPNRTNMPSSRGLVDGLIRLNSHNIEVLKGMETILTRLRKSLRHPSVSPSLSIHLFFPFPWHNSLLLLYITWLDGLSLMRFTANGRRRRDDGIGAQIELLEEAHRNLQRYVYLGQFALGELSRLVPFFLSPVVILLLCLYFPFFIL